MFHTFVYEKFYTLQLNPSSPQTSVRMGYLVSAYLSFYVWGWWWWVVFYFAFPATISRCYYTCDSFWAVRLRGWWTSFWLSDCRWSCFRIIFFEYLLFLLFFSLNDMFINNSIQSLIIIDCHRIGYEGSETMFFWVFWREKRKEYYFCGFVFVAFVQDNLNWFY